MLTSTAWSLQYKYQTSVFYVRTSIFQDRGFERPWSNIFRVQTSRSVNKNVKYKPCSIVFLFLLLFYLYEALQKHYQNLEALALDKDAPDDFKDLSGKSTLQVFDLASQTNQYLKRKLR